MKRILLGTVSALALTYGASAADMPVKAPPPPIVLPAWTGFYFGLQGGIAAHRAEVQDLNNFATGGFGSAPTYSASKTGGIFGVNAGYNLQTGPVVFGIEGDWNALGGRAGSTTTVTQCVPACAVSTSFDFTWLATVRGRIGLALDATLFYVTGGAAFAQFNNTATVFGPGGVVVRGAFNQGSTRGGWTIGGGVEHMFTRNWTARAEVRYAGFGHSTVGCTGACNGGIGTYRGQFSNSLLMGLVGVDFKF